MSKTVIVQAQQMWEYMTISRKTADYLVAELNEAGRSGWELVDATYHKEAKTSMSEMFCWTAILKRPLILPAHGPGDTLSSAEETAAHPAMSGSLQPPDMEASIFDVQKDDLDDDDLPGGS
jgi:hypothetical protein